MQKYLITEDMLKALRSYLFERPYREAAPLVAMLGSAKKHDEPEVQQTQSGGE